MRLDLNFVDHPKVKRLIRMAGYEGFYGLIRLFSMAGRLYTNGVFTGCSKEDLDDLADWRGENSFTDYLLEVNFLKEKNGIFEINDWEEHQPWLAGAESRSKKAKKAANARWSQVDTLKEDTKVSNADTKSEQCYEHTTSNAKRNAGSNAPSPSPSPTPTPTPTYKYPYQGIVNFFNEACPSLPKATKVTDKRKKAISAVVKEFGEEGVKSALGKVEESSFLTGENNRGWKADFDWLMNKNNLLKVIEGRYSQQANHKSHSGYVRPEGYATTGGWDEL